MNKEIEKAVEFYNKACFAEERGELNLAEVYYIKSWSAFEEVGGRHILNASNALNALAFLRAARGNYAGAMVSAKQSIQILEKYEAQFKRSEADLIHMQARDLINNLISYELSETRFIPIAGLQETPA